MRNTTKIGHKIETMQLPKVNYLMGVMNLDGTVNRYCLISREDSFEQFIYGNDIPTLAANCKKEDIPFQRGDVITTIKEKDVPQHIIGQIYHDAPVNEYTIRHFTREVESRFL